jgi:hypothetical protein
MLSVINAMAACATMERRCIAYASIDRIGVLAAWPHSNYTASVISKTHRLSVNNSLAWNTGLTTLGHATIITRCRSISTCSNREGKRN